MTTPTTDARRDRATSRVRDAQARRNAQAGHRWRWRAARAALWALLDEHVAAGARVAVIGAGNGNDLPLRRLAGRADRLDLIDIDPVALTRARRRCLGRAVGTLVCDVTGGAADAIVDAAITRSATHGIAMPSGPIAGAPYDVVIADLLYTQLLYPALLDSGVDGAAIDEVLDRDGQCLTDAVVARLHASAPGGVVIHLHDVLGWWVDHPQPFTPADVLDRTDTEERLASAATGNLPRGCDPRAASAALGARVVQTAFWCWPWSPGVEYLVCATVTRSPENGSQTRREFTSTVGNR